MRARDYQEAIMRLACDVPCFTVKHIEGWWQREDGGKKRRGFNRLKGPLPHLEALVDDGLLQKDPLKSVTMNYNKEVVRWLPGEPPPPVDGVVLGTCTRTLSFARRWWITNPMLSETGLTPAVELTPQHISPSGSGEEIAGPDMLSVYRATPKALARDGTQTVSPESYLQVRKDFAEAQPECDCREALKSPLLEEIAITETTRGMVVASFYLDMISRGRQTDPKTEFAESLPVAFERNWQTLGSLSPYDITPDALQVFPGQEFSLAFVSFALLCPHAAEAFHGVAEQYMIPYLLA